MRCNSAKSPLPEHQ